MRLKQHCRVTLNSVACVRMIPNFTRHVEEDMMKYSEAALERSVGTIFVRIKMECTQAVSRQIHRTLVMTRNSVSTLIWTKQIALITL